MTFAEKLIELRKSRGWSQEELGDKLGVTRQTVSKWELGSTTPEMEKIAAMSELFSITTDELIKGTAPQQATISEDKIPENAEVIIVEKHHRIGFEYKSERTWHGLPLVHINLRGTAEGVFAVGLAAKGIVAIGLAALGVIPIGFAALGILAIGGLFALGVISTAALSAGIISLGGISIGVFSLGGLSAGWFSFGGFSVGKYVFGGYANGDIAIGGTARGIIAAGSNAEGEFVFNPPVSAEEFRAAIMSRLPNTPKFIVDLFSRIVEALSLE